MQKDMNFLFPLNILWESTKFYAFNHRFYLLINLLLYPYVGGNTRQNCFNMIGPNLSIAIYGITYDQSYLKNTCDKQFKSLLKNLFVSITHSIVFAYNFYDKVVNSKNIRMFFPMFQQQKTCIIYICQTPEHQLYNLCKQQRLNRNERSLLELGWGEGNHLWESGCCCSRVRISGWSSTYLLWQQSLDVHVFSVLEAKHSKNQHDVEHRTGLAMGK